MFLIFGIIPSTCLILHEYSDARMQYVFNHFNLNMFCDVPLPVRTTLNTRKASSFKWSTIYVHESDLR